MFFFGVFHRHITSSFIINENFFKVSIAMNFESKIMILQCIHSQFPSKFFSHRTGKNVMLASSVGRSRSIVKKVSLKLFSPPTSGN